MSFALLGLKLLGFGRGIVTWLSHRSVAELALIALALFAVVQRFELSHARSDAARWRKQDAAHVAELKAISTKRNEQRVVTKERIVIAERKAKDADGVAKKIEAAPLPGLCATPREILGADL